MYINNIEWIEIYNFLYSTLFSRSSSFFSFLFMVSEPLAGLTSWFMANATSSTKITSYGDNNTFPATNNMMGLNVPIKLTWENFLLWKTQMFPVLNYNDFAHILTQDPPVPMATNSADEIIVNPAYQAWRKQDQQVLSILVSSLSENILPCVVGKTTSKEAWDALNKHCSSSNLSRIMHLHNRLHNSSKGTRSIFEYVQDIRRPCD